MNCDNSITTPQPNEHEEYMSVLELVTTDPRESSDGWILNLETEGRKRTTLGELKKKQLIG